MPVTIDGSVGILSPDFEPNGSTVPTNGLYLPTTNTIAWATNSTEKLRLDASGNLGLGVTPSAWVGKAFEIGYAGSAIQTSASGYMRMMANTYQGSGGNFYYAASATKSALYEQNAGQHIFYTAGTGTAGNAISFTQAMTLDASGNLLVGTTSNAFSSRFCVQGTAGSSTPDVTIGVPVNSSGNTQLQIYRSAATSGYIGLEAVKAGVSGGDLVVNAVNGGNLLVGTTTSAGFGSANRIYKNVAQGGFVLAVDAGSEYASLFQAVSGGGYNTNAAAQWIGKNTGNNRSINAGGTVNANGADYAEYMTKAGDFEIAKGDVCGIDANGLLTNVFSDAVSFVIKSTDPSYVGNDSWGAGIEDQDALEIERQKVDRIAFAGQVPVNVLGASPGDYIVPIDDSGSIKGEAVANPTLEQYQKAVGKVIAIESDGRARIIVKVA